MFKDIVLAATKSEASEAAANVAFAFARKHEATLVITHVCGLPSHGWGSIEHLIPSGEVDRIKRQVREYYWNRISDLPDCRIEVVPGVPYCEILRLAHKINADLIVMGSHTKDFAGENRRMTWGMTGSTLERVSQKAKCPVMIVSRPLPQDHLDFRNIVATTDFSYQAECAISYASQMARHYGAHLHIFHVLDVDLMEQLVTNEEVEQIKRRMAEEYGDKLKGLQSCTYETWEGTPSLEILKFARQKNADLIIMAHHSKEVDPEKAYLGSTVAHVALNARQPTISVNRHFDLRCGMYD